MINVRFAAKACNYGKNHIFAGKVNKNDYIEIKRHHIL